MGTLAKSVLENLGFYSLGLPNPILTASGLLYKSGPVFPITARGTKKEETKPNKMATNTGEKPGLSYVLSAIHNWFL